MPGVHWIGLPVKVSVVFNRLNPINALISWLFMSVASASFLAAAADFAAALALFSEAVALFAALEALLAALVAELPAFVSLCPAAFALVAAADALFSADFLASLAACKLIPAFASSWPNSSRVPV